MHLHMYTNVLLQLCMHQALPPPLPPHGMGPIYSYEIFPLHPLWCGGGVELSPSPLWCGDMACLGKYGMFGMYGRYAMYGMNGCYCMDGKYGM